MTLRRRLLRFILAPLLLSLFVAGAASFFAAKKETAEVYDKQLVLLAKVLYSLALQEDKDDQSHRISDYDAILGAEDENIFFYRIWIDGELALTSHNASQFKAIIPEPGFSDHSFGGELWRVYNFTGEKKNNREETNREKTNRDGNDRESNDIVVEVAGIENLRSEIIEEILLFMFIPLLLAVPLIAGLVWYGVIRGLRPISVFSNLIKSRDPHNLSPLNLTKAQMEEIPGEIIPLYDALNSLMLRTKNVLDGEKNFADNAAHELQTPLAAIKTQAQVAMLAVDNDKKQQMLEELVLGVDRASHLVSQLLNLARAQSEQQNFLPVRFDHIIESVVGEFQQQLADRNQSVTLDMQKDIVINGIEELLFVFVRNLIDNAIKYSIGSDPIQVALFKLEDNVVLRIGNRAKRISEDQSAQIFEPFYRLPGQSEIGCGLGLSLVKKICDLHNGEIKMTYETADTMVYFTASLPMIAGSGLSDR